MAAYTKVILIAMCFLAVLSAAAAQWGFQGNLSPSQAGAGYSGSLPGSSYQGSYQGSQSGYQGNSQGGYNRPQTSAGYQGNAYAN